MLCCRSETGTARPRQRLSFKSCAGSLAGGAGSLAGSFKRKAELLELPTVTKRCKARLFSIALLFLSSTVSTTQQLSL